MHQRLSELREHLLLLHKQLIDSERIGYEQAFGPVGSSYDFLQLVLSNPWFTWLRPLSALVASIDEALDPKNTLTLSEATALMNEARSLLKPSEEGHGFARSYHDALQREPGVVLAHAAVIQCLKAPLG
jgi:hypothetical protein